MPVASVGPMALRIGGDARYSVLNRADMNLTRLILVVFLCVMQGTILAASAAATQEGEASYYDDSLNGRKTASGGIYDKNALTAAHRSLPFGTKVRVTYLKTGQSVVVVINERASCAKDRIIDTPGAAVRLEIMEP